MKRVPLSHGPFSGTPPMQRQASPEPAAEDIKMESVLDSFIRMLAERVACHVADQLAARPTAPEPATDLPNAWVDKRTACKTLGISTSTIDRLVREGAPVHIVGARRHFNLDEIREWLSVRGSRPTTPPRRVVEEAVDDAEVVDLAVRAGLHRADSRA
jgi:predicted DNA-binding transcriptional regulator AlpA